MLSLEFSCLQQILDYPTTEYNESLCKEGCFRPLCLISWGKINFTCCMQGKWNSPPKRAKYADVLTCDSDSSNSPWSASASSCLSVLRVGVTRTYTLFHWVSVLCPSPLTFLCSFHGCCQGLPWDGVTVCFDHHQDSSMSRFFMQLPLGPQIEPLEHPSISTELELRFGWELTHCFLPTERLDTMCQLVDCAMTTIR